MSRRALRALLAAAVVPTTLLAGVLASSPASAERVTVADPTGDVWWFGEGPTGPVVEPAPERTQVDVKQVRVDHQARSLVMRSWFVSLPTSQDPPNAGPTFVVRRSAGAPLNVSVDLGYGELSVWSEDDAAAARCTAETTSWSVDAAARSVTAVLDRGCLGRQRWVRVSSTASMQSSRFPFVDVVGTAGSEAREATMTRRLRAG